MALHQKPLIPSRRSTKLSYTKGLSLGRVNTSCLASPRTLGAPRVSVPLPVAISVVIGGHTFLGQPFGRRATRDHVIVSPEATAGKAAARDAKGMLGERYGIVCKDLGT